MWSSCICCFFFKCYYVDFSFDSFVGQRDQSTYFQIESSLERLKRNLLDCSFITIRGNQQRSLNKKVERPGPNWDLYFNPIESSWSMSHPQHLLKRKSEKMDPCHVTVISYTAQIFHSVKNKKKQQQKKKKTKPAYDVSILFCRRGSSVCNNQGITLARLPNRVRYYIIIMSLLGRR
jgi:hypothetical protein